MMILRLALQKIRAMAGGYGFFAAVLAAAFALFFIIAATLGTTRTQLLRIALTDEDDSPLSHEFAELLNDSDGEITGGKTRFVSVRFGTREESEEAVRSGKAEGALIILKGFGAGLESGEEAFLEYRASADASSAQAAEEIIGGRAVALRSRLRSADYAKKLLNRGLTEKELSELEVTAKEYYNEQVGAVRFERIGGSVEKADSSVFGALRARFSGIGAFAGADAAADFGVVDGLECGAGGGKAACSGKRRSEHFVLEQFFGIVHMRNCDVCRYVYCCCCGGEKLPERA